MGEICTVGVAKKNVFYHVFCSWAWDPVLFDTDLPLFFCNRNIPEKFFTGQTLIFLRNITKNKGTCRFKEAYCKLVYLDCPIFVSFFIWDFTYHL